MNSILMMTIEKVPLLSLLARLVVFVVVVVVVVVAAVVGARMIMITRYFRIGDCDEVDNCENSSWWCMVYA